MMKLYWYFDFISPFAYLQHCQFNRLPDNIELEYKPILFAGLLKHWKNIGPAEIPPKRIFTYKHCYWRARKEGIAFKMPPAHPFNPLLPLRLAIATGNQKAVINTLFETIWKQGLDINSQEAMAYIQEQTNLSDIHTLSSTPDVKQQLIANTEEAANHAIFGVPTFSVAQSSSNRENFWGLDAFEMLLEYIDNPNRFNDAEMQRIETIPEGIQRKQI